MMKNDYLIPVVPFHDQILVSGKGSYVYDTRGKKYLDLNCGQFCAVLGHANRELSARINEISVTLNHTSSGMLSQFVIDAAEKVNYISGLLDARVIFLSTGAEAVEFAIRYAKHITGKSGLVCFDKGYHGLTLGTQSITFGGKYACPKVSEIYSIPVPKKNSDIKDCLDVTEKVFTSNKGRIAAVVMEPIVSVGGMIYPNKEFFLTVREMCDDNGVLLLFDESQTGFGRTGSWFCYQEFDVIPDMVICSKGIGMGYPVAAVLFHGNLLECNITMTHYSSHQNDPFGAGIVSFLIDYVNRNDILSAVRVKGNYFIKKLIEISAENPMFRNPRGHGLMLGMDIFIDGVDDYRPIYKKIHDIAAERGVLLQGTDGGRVLRFLPDYLMAQEDIDFCSDVIKGIQL